jgi:hypothetical protein
MNLVMLASLLPIGCQTAVHDNGQLEVYRDLQNGNRYSVMFDPAAQDEDEVAEAVFNGLYQQKYGADFGARVDDGTVPEYSPGAAIDI